MTIAMNKINKKIPGLLPPPPKSEIDGKIVDLSSKTISELIEIRDRQVKLINNKFFLNKLADKGAKIQAFHFKILQEIKAKQNEEQTCRLFDQLNLNKKIIQDVEWISKLDNRKDTYLDSDDESEPEDVLQILSQNTVQEKQIKILKPEKSIVTSEDLLKIGEIPHVKYIVEKTEAPLKPKPTGQFKPYKSTKTDVHNPEKEISRKKSKHWEVTAATPPPSVHGAAKLLSIEDSLKLQTHHNSHIKEVEAQHAAEKLLARTGMKIGELPQDISKLGKYRDVASEDSDESDPEGSDKEVYDEEPEKGGVIFTVMK